MKKETWIIVANSTHARLFTVDGVTLKEKNAMVHPECRMHEKDLTSDKPGSTDAGSGSGRYSMEPKHSPKKNEMTIFAKEIADCIEGARKEGKLEKLYLAASPSLLGLMRNEFSSPTADIIVAQVDKDITHYKPKEIYQWYADQKF